MSKNFKLYGITNKECLNNISLFDAVKAALEGGITCLQYREKKYSKNIEAMTNEEREELLKIRELCAAYNVSFIVNDNVELAKIVNADGVHIGKEDSKISEARKVLGTKAIIGATAKTVEEAVNAYKAGADYLGCGAVFGSDTKKEAKPMEISMLKEICKCVPIPVVAIGGITLENVALLEGTGISGIAVIKGIFGEKDIESVCKRYLEQLNILILPKK